eukprot:TRINITY_DN65372_c0_g1_i1.p1 TRINITY_DN65372_c0_g1~~TRINITY_DN65372_c0_g1_i1.p1  ORF type:complete len:763 (+),score=239.54 TRINITY_DN65372_c0_g1_i1:137-2425(+)
MPSDAVQQLRDRLQQLSVPDQIAADQPIMQGIQMFMDNRYRDAEQLFKEHSGEPVGALAYAGVMFLRALMSWEPDDMAEARKRLGDCEHLAAALCPGDGLGGAVSSLFKGSRVLSNFELRCKCVRAEARLLRSLLHITEESVLSWLRAAKGLNDGYSDFDHLNRHLKAAISAGLPPGAPCGAPPHAKQAGVLPDRFATVPGDPEKVPGSYPHSIFGLYDYHSVGGVQFGIGAINVVISILPARVLALLKILGFMHDRDAGYRNLSACVDGGGVRSPVAALMLLFFHGTLPSFSGLLAKRAIEGGRAQHLIDALVLRYPRSSIFLWQAGRVARLHRRLADADLLLSKAVADGNRAEFKQLVHLSEYELAWTRVFGLQWMRASPLFDSLQRESGWSPAFYTYAKAVCADQAGDLESAHALYREALDHCGRRKFGGKTLSVEQYVQRKVQLFAKREFRHTLLPGVQLALLFNSLPQTPAEVVERVLEMARRCRGECAALPHLLPCELAAIDLVIANCVKELCIIGGHGYDTADAARHYEAIEKRFPKKGRSWRQAMPEESWVMPYCCFEHGCLMHLMGDDDAAARLFKEADAYSDYNFEMPLALRLHLTRDLLKGGGGMNEEDALAAPGACLLSPAQRRALGSGRVDVDPDAPPSEPHSDLDTFRSCADLDGGAAEGPPTAPPALAAPPPTTGHMASAPAQPARSYAAAEPAAKTPPPAMVRAPPEPPRSNAKLKAAACLLFLIAIALAVVVALQQEGVIATTDD